MRRVAETRIAMAYDEHIRSAVGQLARCAIVTLSDTRTEESDKSGRRIRELLEKEKHSIVHYQILPDEPKALDSTLTALLNREDIDVILTSGGTGISRRDRTIDTIAKRLDTSLDGFGELFRMLSWQQIQSGAMLSRALAGISSGKAIFAMPGSTAAVDLAMTQLILPQIKHILSELRK